MFFSLITSLKLKFIDNKPHVGGNTWAGGSGGKFKSRSKIEVPPI